MNLKPTTAIALTTLVAVPLAGLVWAATTSAMRDDTDRIARGKYLVTYGDCNACHTPLKPGANGPEPDWSRMLAGHPAETELPPPPNLEGSPWFAATAGMTAWAGPWGISYAANLTPDQNTGMGIWTEEMFIQAMRTGRHMGSGRPILPPMPWHSIATLSDDDLKAIFAYLRTLPAIANSVPGPLGPDGQPMFSE
ncbi:MAG: c-type cytochrome [Verrucomicrobia bacterium]|nr:c-type cytochrome [Verrucomicrobiota bacterium]